METYLFTHFSKQINKSVLFVVQVPITAAPPQSQKHPRCVRVPDLEWVSGLRSPVYGLRTPDPFLRILCACVPFCRRFDIDIPSAVTIDCRNNCRDFWRPPIGFSRRDPLQNYRCQAPSPSHVITPRFRD